jgi:two-component system nitrogen regulation sensor histidine kinase NtrY
MNRANKSSMAPTRIKRIRFKKRIARYTATLLIVPFFLVVLLLHAGDFSLKIWLTVLFVMLVGSLLSLGALLDSIFRPLQSATNIVSAIREGDYSMKSRPSSLNDPLGELYHEINGLTGHLQRQNQSAVESKILLNGIMESIDIAVFVFDSKNIITQVNRAGAALLNLSPEAITGKTAAHFNLNEFIDRKDKQTVRHTFPAKQGRWSVSKNEFREDGKPCCLVMIQDVSQSLREEERTAWKRLIRVMGHELNNSLAPIKSISSTLNTLVKKEDIDEELKEDLEDGLEVIQARADALSRFVGDYSKIAKLPPPNKSVFNLSKTIHRIVELQDFKGCSVEILECGEIDLYADEAQIEQLLINLTKNAIEANQPTQGKAYIQCRQETDKTVIEVIDEGLGLASSDNLFIPFYSTKPGGSGIGLTLGQQISENHEGALELKNRIGAQGCIATVTLPNPHTPTI